MPFTVTKLEQHSEGSLRGASARLTFGKLASESLQDPGFVDSTNWAGATDWSDTMAGSTSYLHSGGTGTLTQANAKMITAGSNSKRYRITYTISSINIAGALTLAITTAFAGSAVSLAIAATGTFTKDFVSDASASSADFVLSATSTTALDAFTLTNVSLKRIPDYASGGESLTPNMLGLGQFVGDVVLPQGENGLLYHWDRTNQKIVVMAQNIPQLIVDEIVTMTSDAGTLAYPPAYIVSIVEGGTSQVYRIVGSGKVAVDNESVAVNFVTGGIVNIVADAPANLYVTYFPQRPGTFFSKENLVIDEVIVPSATPVNLDSQAAAIQYVAGDTSPILFEYDTPGDAPDSGSVTIDMDDGSDGTTLDFHTDEVSSEATCTVTYLKASGLGGDVSFIDEQELDMTSNTAQGFSWILDTGGPAPFGDTDLAVPGYGVNFVGEDGSDTQERATWSGFMDTAADGIIVWNPRANTTLGAQTGTLENSQISWLKVARDAGMGIAEISADQDLSDISIDIFARGR